jgi:HSP20 family protein
MSTRSARHSATRTGAKATAKAGAKRPAKAAAKNAKPAAKRDAKTAVGAARSGSAAAGKSVPARTGTLLPAGESSLMSQLDRWFERSFGGLLPARLLERLGEPLDVRMPRVDVLNRETDVLVRAELPGIDKKDVHVSLSERALTIRAASASESERREGTFYHQEISQQSYERTILLPSGVDTERARASLSHGVLEVSIPKLGGGAKKAIDIR